MPNDELPRPFPFPAASAEEASPRQLTIARPKDCFRFSFISLPFPLLSGASRLPSLGSRTKMRSLFVVRNSDALRLLRIQEPSRAGKLQDGPNGVGENDFRSL